MTDQKQVDFESWELDKLSDHIIDNHHSYVRKSIVSIKESIQKVIEKYKSEFPETVEISNTFDALAKALEEHLDGEEKYLFPFVKKMLGAKRDGVKIPKPVFRSLESPLKQHVKDHDGATKLMLKINELSKGYQLPQGVNGDFQTLYKQLNDFQKDLKQHIHLEDDILFGKSMELEKQVVEQ